MKITYRFSTTVKYLLLFTLIMIIYSLILSMQGLNGISISNPSENSTIRVLLNHLSGVLVTSALWIAIGYATQDFRAAMTALVVQLAIILGMATIQPLRLYAGDTMTQLISMAIGTLPFLVFGFLHFKGRAALGLLAVWVFIYGIGIAYSPHVFERMIEGLTRIVGIRDPFEIRISTGETSYRPISVLRAITTRVNVLVNFMVFWVIYHIVKDKRSLWSGLHTCHPAHRSDRLTYSIIYWSLRLVLFVTALGITSYIGNSFRSPFSTMVVIQVALFTFAIVMLACIYRNFLVSHAVRRSQYPGGLFFFLNVPILNVLAWLYALLTFDSSAGTDNMDLTLRERVKRLNIQFLGSGQNISWKIVVILFSIVSLLYQLNRAGFRLDGPSRDGIFWVVVMAFVTLGLMLWYLFDHNAYLIILIMVAANIVLAAAVRSESILPPSVATGLVNAALFYGLFYFDKLKWDLPPKLPANTEDE